MTCSLSRTRVYETRRPQNVKLAIGIGNAGGDRSACATGAGCPAVCPCPEGEERSAPLAGRFADFAGGAPAALPLSSLAAETRAAASRSWLWAWLWLFPFGFLFLPDPAARAALPAGLGFRFTVLAAGRFRATAALLRFRELLTVPIPNHATVSHPPVST